MYQKFLKAFIGIFSLILGVTMGLSAQPGAESVPSAEPGTQSVLRVKIMSAVKQVDPIWTTDYAVRDHGYMVYDTLFSMDDKYNVQPQMVDTYSISDDKLVYTFTLRDGLKWHDGTPVTSKDCVASIKRWGARDSMGKMLIKVTEKFKVIDDKRFSLILKEPYGLVLESLGKIDSNVPFMMKEEQALTSPDDPIKEVIGSGPFKFVKEEFSPGNKAVYVKNKNYIPRKEPASNVAGGKIPRVDRVEFIHFPDASTAVNALSVGEIDYIMDPPTDLLPVLEKVKGIKIEIIDSLGTQPIIRLNHLQPPFDNPKVRQAVLWAVNVESMLRSVVGNRPELFELSPSMYGSKSPFASDVGSEPLMKQDFNMAKRLLTEGGYNNEPIVILQATDDFTINNQSLVLAQDLRKVGFNVDLQAMDFSTLADRRTSKKPASEGGWHIFLTFFANSSFMDPVSNLCIGAAGENEWYGWPSDEQIEKLRKAFTKETDFEKKKKLAMAIQKRAYEIVTYIPLGTYFLPSAYSDKLEGILESPIQIFWNVRKK